MPTYNALDFSVRLRVWDPKRILRQSDKKEICADSSSAHPTEEVSEEYFEGRKGVSFLEQTAAPFYLINAGRDLFFRRNSHPLEGCKDLRPQAADRDSASPNGEASSRSLSAILADRTPGLGINTAPTRFESDSPLSSVPENFDSSPPFASDGDKNVKRSVTPINGPRIKTWQKKQSNSNAILKPLSTAVPMQVQISFSKKAFAPSLYDERPQDLCINIFHNGDFVYSKVYRADTERLKNDLRVTGHYSGRRIGMGDEVPYSIMPLSDGSFSKMNPRTSPEQQWDNVNSLILKEADRWGRAGKYDMFRSPIGEYLESLSKLAIPKDLKGAPENGRTIGILDVVVCLGRTVAVYAATASYKPERRLPSKWISNKFVDAGPEDRLRKDQPQWSRKKGARSSSVTAPPSETRPKQQKTAGKTMTENRMPTTASSRQVSGSHVSREEQGYSLTTILKSTSHISQPPVVRKHARPETDSSPPIAKRQRLAERAPNSYTTTREESLESNRAPTEDHQGQALVETQRPVRNRVPTKHFDGQSSTPSQSMKSRPSTPNQIGRMNVDNQMESVTNDATVISPAIASRSLGHNLNSKMFGTNLDGANDDDDDDDDGMLPTARFGLDGSTAKRSSKPTIVATPKSAPRSNLTSNGKRHRSTMNDSTNSPNSQSPSAHKSKRQRASRTTGRHPVSTSELKGLLDAFTPNEAAQAILETSAALDNTQPMKTTNGTRKSAEGSNQGQVSGKPAPHLKARAEGGMLVVRGIKFMDWKDLHARSTTSSNMSTPVSTPASERNNPFSTSRNTSHGQQVSRSESVASTTREPFPDLGTLEPSMMTNTTSTDNASIAAPFSATGAFARPIGFQQRVGTRKQGVPVGLSISTNAANEDLLHPMAGSQKTILPIHQRSPMNSPRVMPSTPPLPSPRLLNAKQMDRAASDHGSNSTRARQKPNLVIQTEAPERSHRSTEGAKTPTPRSGSFHGSLPPTPDLPNDGFPAPTSRRDRETAIGLSRSLSNPSMPTFVNPMSSPYGPVATPVFSSGIQRQDRVRPSPLGSSPPMMSSPTPLMGPPPARYNNAKETTNTSFRQQSSSAKFGSGLLAPPGAFASTKPIDNLQRSSPAGRDDASQNSQASAIEPSYRPMTLLSSPPDKSSPSRTQATSTVPAKLPFKPLSTCRDSVLSFPSKALVAQWLCMEEDNENGYAKRKTRAEREGVFRSHSILMGVRYVLGADFELSGVEECESGLPSAVGNE